MRLGPILVVALASAACDPDTSSPTGRATTSADIPEPVIPTASASAPTADQAWIADLPEVAPVAAAGDRVWATIPGATSVPRLGVFTVEGVYDGLYSLTDRTGQRVDGIPPAVVHPAAREKVEEGQVVFFDAPSAPGLLGKVADLVPGGAIEVIYDWGGKTRKSAVDHVQKPPTGIRPLAFVSFPKAGQRSRGLIVALDAQQAFVRTGSGHVEKVPRAGLRSLPLPRPSYRQGQRVRAYRWANGFHQGVVAEVIEPGLRYRIDLDGDRPEQVHFFTSLSSE